MKRKSEYLKLKKRVSSIIEVGYIEDIVGRSYDILNLVAIAINLLVGILLTFDDIVAEYGTALLVVERITVAFFALDYFLRVWTADALHPELPKGKAILKYLLSFNGIVDLLSFLPYYLPFFFPAGAVAFRMFRVMRIFRLFRLNAYYDSLNVITEVIVSKGRQLISSLFVILIMMLASSLCMYSLEHQAQPEVFDNAFSGIWWAANTLLTVGYGDIYPITPGGRVMGVVLAFLGVGVVAIPTGIISAGFVEQYSRLKQLGEENAERNLRFIRVKLDAGDPWIGRRIKDLKLTHDIIVAIVRRNEENIVPTGDLELLEGDEMILGAERRPDGMNVILREVTLGARSSWAHTQIRDLDISRTTYIISVRREHRVIVPSGDLELLPGDVLLLYSRKHIPDSHPVEL
ncbi:MAG: ion transporter [Lachnospiraceae bacterium]|nr:ion transporter [Lachnospiraceae bacterium]